MWSLRQFVVPVCWLVLLSASLSTTTAEDASESRQLSRPAKRAGILSYFRQAFPGPGATPYPIVEHGPQPWYGQAMGAPTFNYGFFGAHQHKQYVSRNSYYGDYHDRGHARGY